MEVNYGILSVIPPLLVIILALKTKKTLLSLFLGTWAGVTIINGWNPFLAFPKMVTDFIQPAIANDWNAGSLILVTVAGGFVYLLKVSGAAQSLGEAAVKKIKTRKSAQIATVVAGFGLIYTEPCFTLGVIMRPITEKLGVARVKLAYIIDSMGCNLASMSPICSYGPYIAGLIATQLAAAGLATNPWTVYGQYITYNFYGIFAILTVVFVAATGLDVGPMYEAEQRAIKTGQLIGPNDHPMVMENPEELKVPEGVSLTIKNFAVPMLTLFVTLFAVIFWSGDVVKNGVAGAFLNGSITLAISCGMVTGAIACVFMANYSKIFKPSKGVDKWVKGVVDMTEVNMILVMAWALGNVIGAMNLKGFIAGLLNTSSFPPALIPALVFLFGACVSFSTGTSWGTWAIMMPIAIPIAIQFGFPIPLAVAGVIGGGLFGDHCSPISDTTILASTASASDHVEHVRTQLPYAFTVGISALIGFVAAGLASSQIIGFIATAAAIVLGINILNRIAKKQIAEKELIADKELSA